MPRRKYSRIFLALPVMNEMQCLPALMEAIKQQGFKEFELFVCVNQPEHWWEEDDKKNRCLDNQQAIQFFREYKDFPVRIIDRSSRGKGWKGKAHGVGWARKTVMDSISLLSGKDDLLVSLDADTLFNSGYFTSLLEGFNDHPEAVAMAVPYYHRLVEDEEANRAILRYEIYMRNYNINLWRIDSPYAFTALGSAMAMPVWSYRAVGGMTPKTSGEDFYFLQKLRKFGRIIVWNPEKVYPGTRFSDRVYFGTGPAMIKGRAGDWSSYPVYHYSLFDKLQDCYFQFEKLYTSSDVKTPLDDFLRGIFKEQNIWEPLRLNTKSPEQFLRACHDRLDGLRILQFLKASQPLLGKSDAECLKDNIGMIISDSGSNLKIFDFDHFSFSDCTIDKLNLIRDIFVDKEGQYQQKTMIH